MRRHNRYLTLVSLGLAIALSSVRGVQAERTAGQAVPVSRPAAASAPTFPQRDLLDRYCVTCHNEKAKTAGLMLDRVDLRKGAEHAEVLEKVARKLSTGEMPPAGMPRPDKAAADAFASGIVTALDHAAAAARNPGRVLPHRLNRAEYVNAIRDILALDLDGRALLPADDSSYGFDNIADVLSMSPSLLTRYMSAAAKISRLAIADPTMRPVSQTYRVSKLLRQDVRMSDDLPFATQGGAAIRHAFPVDAEYFLKVRLCCSDGQNGIRGIDKPHRIEFRLDGVRLKMFSVGGEVTEGADRYRIGIALPEDDAIAERLQVYRQTGDKHLEVRFAAKAGTHVIGIAFIKEPVLDEGPQTQTSFVGKHSAGGEPAVQTILVAGPYNAVPTVDTASRRRIFVCYPRAPQEEAGCATRILSTIARRAYRRPVIAADMQPLRQFYEEGRRAGGFEAGIQHALEAILVDPEFLFRIEQDPAALKAGSVYRLGDLQLASRLSFFLWSSVPDDELLAVAERRELRDPAVLARQVVRMMKDPRASAWITNFAGQWLHLRNTRLVAPDPDLFPGFDDNLREAFTREMELFVESQVKEDRSVLELLTADYSFVNERLARHYGIKGVYGSHFRRITLDDRTRWGLLGKGSILTVTSYAHRTSPVVRGKWVLENILGTPPPPPPPNVPSLEENKPGARPTSIRERLEQHRKNPVCASCHARMDPLGFALENFDAIGQWRDSDAGIPIESTSVLADGTKLDGPVAFRTALLARRDEFVLNVTEKLLTYALGRGVDYLDAPAIRQVVREAAGSDYRWSSLVRAVVGSMPFLMKKVDSPEPDAATRSAKR